MDNATLTQANKTAGTGGTDPFGAASNPSHVKDDPAVDTDNFVLPSFGIHSTGGHFHRILTSSYSHIGADSCGGSISRGRYLVFTIALSGNLDATEQALHYSFEPLEDIPGVRLLDLYRKYSQSASWDPEVAGIVYEKNSAGGSYSEGPAITASATYKITKHSPGSDDTFAKYDLDMALQPFVIMQTMPTFGKEVLVQRDGNTESEEPGLVWKDFQSDRFTKTDSIPINITAEGWTGKLLGDPQPLVLCAARGITGAAAAGTLVCEVTSRPGTDWTVNIGRPARLELKDGQKSESPWKQLEAMVSSLEVSGDAPLTLSRRGGRRSQIYDAPVLEYADNRSLSGTVIIDNPSTPSGKTKLDYDFTMRFFVDYGLKNGSLE